MKRIMMLFLVLFFLLSTKNVFAQDQYHLTLEEQKGIYMARRGVSYGYDSYPFYIYKMNGMYAYCIEPGKHITTYTYTGVSDYVDLGFSEELKEKLELIGYYGRDYPGHNNVRYSMATQALIWELTGVDKVTFWTKLNEKGEEIDVTNERNEIMNLVNNHKTLPNFKTSYTGHLKREFTINDTNKVLDNFDIIESGGNDVYIDNNTIHIIPKKYGKTRITLKRKSYDEYNTIIFVGKGNSSSQKLGRLHFNKEIKTDINLVISGISIIGHKVDENNKPIKKSGIMFKIKNTITGEYVCPGSICTIKTDSNGIFKILSLDYGEYEIEELENQVIQGYYWNKEKLKVSINENTIIKWDDTNFNYIDINFKNNSVKTSFELYKTGEKPNFMSDSINYSEVILGNITFDLYKENGEYIKTFTVDNNGYAKIDDLKVGNYYLVEKTKLDNYIEKGKIPFSLKQENQYQESIGIKYHLQNILKKGYLEFSKVDSITGKGIPNTIVEIYDINNNLLYTKETDKNGKVYIDKLPYGKYYIKEKEANYYYAKSDEIVYFEIKNSNETVKPKMVNKRIMGKVEVTKLGQELNTSNNIISYNNIPLNNFEFYLYNENDELITTLKTNSNGYASKELELGKYYLVEKTKLSNYQEDNKKYYFEIKKNGNEGVNVKLTINNYLKKGNIEFSKEDNITHYGIPNTIIEIYNDKNKLLLTKKTDSNGKIIINNLPIGKYYIKEKEPNYFYKPTNEIVNFEIKTNELVKKTLTNEKITGKLEINKKAENYHFINNDVYYDKENIHAIEFDLYDENSTLIDHIITDNNGYASYVSLPLGKYYLVEKTGLSRFIDIGKKYYFEIKKKDFNTAVDVSLEIVNYLKKGSLEFSKTDFVTSEGIPNTIIEIYNENDLLLFTKETDKEGKVVIPSLPFGKYYIIEKEANYNYEKTDEKVYFEIKENGEIVRANMTNKKIVGNLEIIKKGEEYHIINNSITYDKENLHSIEFDIFDEKDELIGNIKTDNNGYAKYSNLPLGNYYLKEKTVLDNYISNSDKINFTLDKDDKDKAIDVVKEVDNYLKKGTLEFSKTDFVTSEGIPNTIIEIYNENNLLLFTKETDKEGKVVISDLPYGKYYIIEKEANYNYEKTFEKVFFEIKENGEIVKANMKNKRITGSLEIEKYGEEYQIINGEMVYEKIKLSDIEFELYDNNDKLINTLITDDNGYIKYSGLSFGKYYLKEKSNNSNYISNDDKIYFEIKKDDNKAVDVKLNISNYLKKGNLEFSKVDLVTNEGIPNTIIEIYDENNNLWFTKETNEFGKVTINNLPMGKYYIIEKEANTLYMITNEKVFFEIKEDGEIVKANMTNEKIEVPVPKTGTKESIIANTLFGMGFLFGIGGLIYERKRSY